MPVILAERTEEDICEEKLKGTATTSVSVGKNFQMKLAFLKKRLEHR